MSSTSIKLNKSNVFISPFKTNKFHLKTKLNAIQQPPEVTLKQNKIGHSDLAVSEIGMGCMMMGSQNTESEAHTLLNYAWDCGINFLDTSEGYPILPMTETAGKTSKIIGNWIKTRKRDEVIVATKVCGPVGHMKNSGLKMNRYLSPDSDEIIQVESGINKENIKGAAESELIRLKIDEIDLLQFHWPDRYAPSFGTRQYRIEKERECTTFEEQVEAVGELIKEGKIRYWGLSNETTYGLVMMCHTADKLNVPRPISIQNSFGLIDRRFESELAEACSARNLNIGLLPYSVTAGGYLSGKYLNGQRPENSRFVMIVKRYARFESERMNNATKEYADLAKSIDLEPIQLAYLFARSRWFIPSTLIGATNLEQLHENVLAFKHELSDETLKAIDEIYLRHPNPQDID